MISGMLQTKSINLYFRILSSRNIEYRIVENKDNEWMNEWISEWVNELMNEWMNERMNERMNEGRN